MLKSLARRYRSHRPKITTSGAAGFPVLRHLALVLALVAAALAGGTATSSRASATTPQPFTVHIEDNIFSGSGSWTASGAISDSGTFSYVPFAPFGGNGSPVFTGHAIVTLTGHDGAIRFRIDVLFTPTNDPNVFASAGRFVLVGGSGLFSGIQGDGRESGSTNISTGTEMNDLQGKIHFD